MKHAIVGERIQLEMSRPELQALIDQQGSRDDLGDVLRDLAREYDQVANHSPNHIPLEESTP